MGLSAPKKYVAISSPRINQSINQLIVIIHKLTNIPLAKLNFLTILIIQDGPAIPTVSVIA